jgi:hydrogenase nickel incorporation protein HypA/HybF
VHELSLAISILQIVESAARKEHFARVRSLRLSAPTLAGVEVGALRFALQSLQPDTLLAGAELVVDEPPSQATCLDCDQCHEIQALQEPCPHCGGMRWRVSDDAVLRVVDLLVD